MLVVRVRVRVRRVRCAMPGTEGQESGVSARSGVHVSYEHSVKYGGALKEMFEELVMQRSATLSTFLPESGRGNLRRWRRKRSVIICPRHMSTTERICYSASSGHNFENRRTS